MQVGQQVPARRISSIYYTMGLKNGLQSTTLYTIYSLTKTESSVVQIFSSKSANLDTNIRKQIAKIKGLV